jgi:PAS domain S-box-containing protein
MPELARQAFKAIADFTYDWESWIGPEGATRWVNPAVERITGRTPAECLEMPDYPLGLVHPHDRETIAAAMSGAASGGSGNDLEFRVLRPDGELRWCAMSWQPLTGEHGKRLGYRTSVRDISERKRMEQRLRAALARAEESDRTRAAFLAGMSHELRTPIHNLLGYADLLSRCHLGAKPQHWLEIIRDQGEALVDLVDDLLDLSAHDAQRSQRPNEPYDPTDLIRRTTEAHRARIEGKGLQLETELASLPDQILGDARGVAQILRNLLDNARKFTLEGRIAVSAQLHEQGAAQQLVISVSDTGIGMDPNQVEELRRPFARAETSRDRKEEGVGLGLALIDRLVSQSGGELQIVTAEGSGSRFTVTLPVIRAREKTSQRREALAKGPPAESVLVVDDQPVSRELAQEFLEQLGCHWHTAASAHEALLACQQHEFDIVLMDLHMPKIDGVRAAQLIRAQLSPSGRQPRIVAMTADLFAPEVASFDGFLPKPVRLEALRQCLAAQSNTDVDRLGSRPSRDTDGELPALGARPILDDARISELKQTKTASGATFFERFARPTIEELSAIAEHLRGNPADVSEDSPAMLYHRLKNSASIVGATGLARIAGELQTKQEQGCELAESEVEALHAILQRTLKALRDAAGTGGEGCWQPAPPVEDR